MASLGFYEKLLSHLAAGGRGRDEGGQLRAQRAEARHHGQGEEIGSHFVYIFDNMYNCACNFIFPC